MIKKVIYVSAYFGRLLRNDAMRGYIKLSSLIHPLMRFLLFPNYIGQQIISISEVLAFAQG